MSQFNFTDDTTPEEIDEHLRSSMPKHIYEAHQHSTNHRVDIERSEICGCFYCLATFSPNEIDEWIKSDSEEFAICPRCGIDSIIGDASGIIINTKFLREMNKYWFDGDALGD